jgi:hypothetical protein
MRNEIELMRGEIRGVKLVVAMQSMVFLVVLGVIVFYKETTAGPVMRQENNQEMSPVISVDDFSGIEKRAGVRGHFTREEFAEIVGVSVRTLDRKIRAGLVDPAPVRNEAGRVAIALDAELVEGVPTMTGQ